MTTPLTPAHRSVRDGRPHLTLVTNEEHPSAPMGDEQQGPKHAAPARRGIPPVGSATVRALMALGALLSALGMSMGKADAVLSTHQPTEADQDDDEEVYTPGDSMLTATTDTTPSNAARWEPTSAHAAVAASYTVIPTPSTGKHRKSAGTEGWGEWNPDQWEQPIGRHRAPAREAHGHRPKKPLVAHKPVASTPRATPPTGSVQVPELPAVIADVKRI